MSNENYNIGWLIEQISNEITVDADGKGSSSIRGGARLIQIKSQALDYHFDSAKKNPSKLAKKLIGYGFDPAKFSETGIPDTALTIIIDHYANDAGERCTDAAKALSRALLNVGLRVLMQRAKNWQPQGYQPKLPPADIRVSNLAQALKDFGIDMHNPRYEQGLKDLTMNILLEGRSKALPQQNQEVWLGVTECAEELGYLRNYISDRSFRTKLGLYVRKHGEHLERKKEKRYVEGRQTCVNIYRDCEELREIVSDGMDLLIEDSEI